MSRFRVSYVLSEGSDPELSASDDGTKVTVRDTSTARHLRAVIPGAKIIDGHMHVTWALKNRFEMPFELPPELGTRVDASLGTDWTKLSEWLDTCGVEALRGFEGPNCMSFASEVQEMPHFRCLEPFQIDEKMLVNASSVLVSFGYSSALGFTNEKDLVVEIFHDYAPIDEEIGLLGAKTEVGVLKVDTKSFENDYIVNGRVRNLNVDDISKPVVFHHTPVYRSAGAEIGARFVEPYGLHPMLELDVPGPERNGCKLYAKLDTPPSIFFDQDQLQAELPVHDPSSFFFGIWGYSDPEAPVWHAEEGSLAFIELSGPGTYHIPMHLRYEMPAEVPHINHTLPAPTVFYVCEENGLNSDYVPGLSFESVFPKNSAYYVFDSHAVPFRSVTIEANFEKHSQAITMLIVVFGVGVIAVALALRIMSDLVVAREWPDEDDPYEKIMAAGGGIRGNWRNEADAEHEQIETVKIQEHEMRLGAGRINDESVASGLDSGAAIHIKRG